VTHMSPLIEELIAAFKILPGVGPKTAQRLALYVLQKNRMGGQQLARVLQEAILAVKQCEQCRNLSETPVCRQCANHNRNEKLLCVVESPIDVLAIEHTASFSGHYFVLHGHLSPIDGVGPDDIGVPLLQKHLQSGRIEELIIATNPTVEGEATAFYLAQTAKDCQVKATRIAHGVPMGGELEYIDGFTLSRALMARAPMHHD